MTGLLIPFGKHTSGNKDRKNSVKDKKYATWVDAINCSDVFVVVATEAYFSDAVSFAQCEYAKSLQRPFIVLHHTKAEIPKGFFDDVEELHLLEVDELNYEAIKSFADFVNDIMPEGIDYTDITDCEI